jgi:hypothetical protein
MNNPVFVIGVNRSGTKWLSNLLLNHPAIAGIADGAHFGILEADLLTTYPRAFGPFHWQANRIGMIECFAATDYFHRTGLSKEVLYQIDARDYFEFFRQIMDRMAAQRSVDRWLQKFPVLVLPELMRHFPSARFVFITRDMLDNVKSNMKMTTRFTKPNPLKHVFWYHHGLRQMRVYRDNPAVCWVRYEDLATDPEKTMRRVCDHLGLAFTPEVLKTGFRPNTSFGSTAERDRFVSGSDQIRIRAESLIMGLIPLWGYRLIHWVRRRLKTQRAPFVSASFLDIVQQRGLNLSDPTSIGGRD